MNNPKNLCLSISLFCISLMAYSQQLVKPLVEPESGDVYSPDYRYGVVLTSPDGSCYRIRVLNGGTVMTENIACPDDMDFCPTTFDCNGGNPVINNGNPLTCHSVVPITVNWVDCNNELITLPNEQVLTASIGQIQYQSTNGITNSYTWTIPATGPSSQQVTFSYGDPNDLCTFTASIPACEETCSTNFGCDLGNPMINNGNPVACNTVVTIDLNWVDCNNNLISFPGQQGLRASIGQIQYQSTTGVTNRYSWTIPTTSSSSQTVTFSYGDPADLCTFSTTIPACGNPPDGFCDEPLGPLKAAPNLEGHGVTTQAGRGGEVRIVTNTNNSGQGSFRAAVSGNAPKIVIFNVSGQLVSESTIFIGDNTSIYGQCAPGPFEISSHPTLMQNSQICVQVGSDVLIQHLRVRAGPANVPAGSWDAIQAHGSSRVVLDHCDFGWSGDEIIDIGGASTDITVSNSLIHEALRHNNPASSLSHDRAILVWEGSIRVTFLRNLMYGFADRAPQFEADLCQTINNVAYKVGSKKFPHIVHANNTPGTFRLRAEANLAIDSGSENLGLCISDENNYPTASFGVYYFNNMHQFGNGSIIPTAYPTSATNASYCVGGIANPASFDYSVFRVNSDPTNSPPITVLPPASLENHVLQHAGATAHRDNTHDRIKNLLATRTGIPYVDCIDGLYVNQYNNNCAKSVPPTLINPINGNPNIDLNSIDGVPSTWKVACGLAPNANTTQIEPFQDGWTAFDYYIYGMTPQ